MHSPSTVSSLNHHPPATLPQMWLRYRDFCIFFIHRLWIVPPELFLCSHLCVFLQSLAFLSPLHRVRTLHIPGRRLAVLFLI